MAAVLPTLLRIHPLGSLEILRSTLLIFRLVTEESPELPQDALAAFAGATGLAQRMRAERPRDGTTLSMISVLSHLDRDGPLPAGRLAALQRAKPQTLTRTLARLEERGWIERAAGDADRRQVLIHLTDRGAVRLHEDIRSRATWLARAMEPLTPTEREVLRLAGTLMSTLATWQHVEEDA
jgi:DNA-binding MarR family transcriptional regulator